MECFHYRSQCDFQAKQTNNALRYALQPLKKPGTYPRTLKGTHKNLLAPGRRSARAPQLQITLWQWQQGWPRWITRGPELFSDRHAAREFFLKKLIKKFKKTIRVYRLYSSSSVQKLPAVQKYSMYYMYRQTRAEQTLAQHQKPNGAVLRCNGLTHHDPTLVKSVNGILSR